MLDELDRRIIARLCGDLGESLDPFGEIAVELGIEREELLARVRRYQETKRMRRLGAVLKHQNAGFTANGMSVWNVPADQVERVSQVMMRQPEVSHCYERPRLPDWPYNLFAMIHGQTEADCRAVAARIAAAAGMDEYDMLFSVREFKKTSMVYHSR
ncbi:MAG: siroheme decarboxylase subunit beta [Armatimonadota bacterium]